MAHRGNESGMDFEWNNKSGPLDSRSPFAQLSQNAQRFGTPSRKRTNNGFGSPLKQSSNHQQSSPSKPLPPVPAWNSLYNTPRKMNNDADDSSAGETPNNTDHNIDSDATPDNMGLRSALSKFDSATQPATTGAERTGSSPTKAMGRPKADRRDSLWAKFRKIYSPGRGEISRPEHSGAIEKRVKKRRERELQRHASRRRRHSVSDSGDDSEIPAKGSRKTSGSHKDEKEPHWISNLFTFISQHPTVPHILTFYAQLAFNIFLLAGCAYVIYSFWSAVKGDVDKKALEAMADVMAGIAECAREYRINNCDPAKRMPALQTACHSWEQCMARDPAKVGRAKVSAHTFAEIFNSFVEPISWKAMIFTALVFFGGFTATNLAFGFFRDKGQQYHPAYFQPPPPTPQRSFSNQDGQYYNTPWSNAPPLEPGPSGYAQIEGRGSPVRRLVYN